MSQPTAATALPLGAETQLAASLQEFAGAQVPSRDSGFSALLLALQPTAIAADQSALPLPEAAAPPAPAEVVAGNVQPEFTESEPEHCAAAAPGEAADPVAPAREPALALPHSLLQLVLGTAQPAPAPPASQPPTPAGDGAVRGESRTDAPRGGDAHTRARHAPAPTDAAGEPTPLPRELPLLRSEPAASERDAARAESDAPRRHAPAEPQADPAATGDVPQAEPAQSAAAQDPQALRARAAESRSAHGELATLPVARPDAHGQGPARVHDEPAREAARLLPELPAHNEVEFVRSVRVLADQGGGQVQIRLDPPELGGVSLRVAVSEGAVHVTLIADQAPVADLFGRHSAELRHALENLGLRLNQLEVGAGNVDLGSRDAHPRDPDARDAAPRSARRPASPPFSIPLAPRRLDVTTLGAVDLHV
jgi:hypothetical protein